MNFVSFCEWFGLINAPTKNCPMKQAMPLLTLKELQFWDKSCSLLLLWYKEATFTILTEPITESSNIETYNHQSLSKGLLRLTCICRSDFYVLCCTQLLKNTDRNHWFWKLEDGRGRGCDKKGRNSNFIIKTNKMAVHPFYSLVLVRAKTRL